MKVLKKILFAQSANEEAIKKNDPRAVVHFMKLHCKGFKVETKADGTESVKIVGWASTPHLDRHDDIVEPSAFASSIATFMKNPRLLLRHWDEKNIGNVTMCEIRDQGTDEERGLWVEAEVLLNVDDCMTLIKNKQLGTLSIGFRVKEAEYRLLGDETGPTREIRVITDLDLLEISVVDIPANPNAVFNPVKSIAAFFAAVRKAEDEEAQETQGAPQAAPETNEDAKTPDEAGNAAETPAPAQAEAKPEEPKQEGVEVPEEPKVENPEVPPAASDPVAEPEAPKADEPTPEAQALAAEQAAHAETEAKLATATAERDAAKAEAEAAKSDLSKASEDLSAAKKALEDAEKSKTELEKKAADAAQEAEKAHARSQALVAKFSKVGKDPAIVTKAAPRVTGDAISEACRLVMAR